MSLLSLVLRGETRPAPRRVEYAPTNNYYHAPGPEDGWLPIYQNGRYTTGSGVMAADPNTRIRDRDHARFVTRYNPHGRAILRNFVKLAIGGKVRPRWPDAIMGNEKHRKALDDFWADWSRAWKWPKRLKEAARRLVRDGEVLLRRFAEPVPIYHNGGWQMRRMASPRFIDPELIYDPTGGGEEGGVVVGADAETPIAFVKVAATDRTRIEERIPAEEMFFTRAEVDENERRGVSMLTSTLPFITMYTSWLGDRIILNKVRSSVALVRTMDTTAAGVQKVTAQEDALARASRSAYAGMYGTTKAKQFQPGTVINASKGVKYEFIAPNVQAADVAHDGRAILLAISAGTGLAEFMISGDLGQANYGSLLVADGPVEKEAQDFQSELTAFADTAFVWAIDEERRAGNFYGIPASFDPTTVGWDFPRVVVRSRLHETQADSNMVRLGTMSRRTAMERDGLDYATESARMEAEKAAYLSIRDTLPGNKVAPPPSLPSGADNTGDGRGGKAGFGRDRGPSDNDPNDTRHVLPTDAESVRAVAAVVSAAVTGAVEKAVSRLERKEAAPPPSPAPPTPPPAPAPAAAPTPAPAPVNVAVTFAEKAFSGVVSEKAMQITNNTEVKVEKGAIQSTTEIAPGAVQSTHHHTTQVEGTKVEVVAQPGKVEVENKLDVTMRRAKRQTIIESPDGTTKAISEDIEPE